MLWPPLCCISRAILDFESSSESSVSAGWSSQSLFFSPLALSLHLQYTAVCSTLSTAPPPLLRLPSCFHSPRWAPPHTVLCTCMEGPRLDRGKARQEKGCLYWTRIRASRFRWGISDRRFILSHPSTRTFPNWHTLAEKL